MPELPEVENFRQILLPLAGGGDTSAVMIDCPSPVPPKSFPSNNDIDSINKGGYTVTDVLRKGKVLCVVLEKLPSGMSEGPSKNTKKTKVKNKKSKDIENNGETATITGNEQKILLSLHMGMTGRMSSPGNVPGLESLSDNDAYPPPHTHMILSSHGKDGRVEAAFSDPRRFGSVSIHSVEDDAVESSISEVVPAFDELAEDALEASTKYCSGETLKVSTDEEQPTTIVDRLMNQRRGIKAVLLDQRAIVSGVGNWVADEILYRSQIHPDQTFLTSNEAEKLVTEMHHVLSTAVNCLNEGSEFPEEWIFHRRWRSGGGGGAVKDFLGKTISFLQSGGRSSAIVPSLQKKKARTNSVKQKETKVKIVDKKEKTTQPKPEKKVASRKRNYGHVAPNPKRTRSSARIEAHSEF